MTKKIREIRIEGNTAYVPLTQGYEAVIDTADVPLVAGNNWCALVKRQRGNIVRRVYAVRKGRVGEKSGLVLMHRLISKTPDGLETDHIDGNGLDNRRDNLRPATTSQNQHNQSLAAHNTSGYKGVSHHRRSGKWAAHIKLHGVCHYLGSFLSKEEAALAYASASDRLHGEFGRT